VAEPTHGTEAVQIIDLQPLLAASEQLNASLGNLTAGDHLPEENRLAHGANCLMGVWTNSVILKQLLDKYDLSNTKYGQLSIEAQAIPALRQLGRSADAIMAVVANPRSGSLSTSPVDWVRALPPDATLGVRLAHETLRKCHKMLTETRTAGENPGSFADRKEQAAPPVADQIAPVDRAIALMCTWERDGRKYKVKDLALTVGISKSTLYRDERFQSARKAVLSMRNTPPSGSKDRQGNLESHNPEDDED
jgi:hypothetical protein